MTIAKYWIHVECPGWRCVHVRPAGKKMKIIATGRDGNHKKIVSYPHLENLLRQLTCATDWRKKCQDESSSLEYLSCNTKKSRRAKEEIESKVRQVCLGIKQTRVNLRVGSIDTVAYSPIKDRMFYVTFTQDTPETDESDWHFSHLPSSSASVAFQIQTIDTQVPSNGFMDCDTQETYRITIGSKS